MDKPRFNRRQLAFLIGVPLAWAVVLLFHPAPDPQNLLESLRGGTTRWLIVHFATLLFIGLMGVVLHLLLSGMTGPAARVGRFATWPFVLFYGAGEALLGIAVGVLARYANDLPPDDRGAVAGSAQEIWHNFLSGDVLILLGSVGWAVAVVATAIAYRQAGAPLVASILLGLSVMVMFHAPPFGPVGLVCFAAAVALIARSQRTELATDDARRQS